MMRRFRRPFINAVPMTAAQIEVMSKANALAASQQFGQAAPLFAELAREMEASQHPRRAANLHARAAHAYADAGNATEALAQARVALNLFVQYQMVQRTPEFYANITRKLTQHGMVEATNALKAEFGGKVGAIPAPQAAARPNKLLPTNCPKCGAPLGGEVTWTDANTAECGYCGALIRPSA
jgi:hypothetical protein